MNLRDAEDTLRDLGFTPDFVANMITGAQRYKSFSVQRDPDDPCSVTRVTYDAGEYKITEGLYEQ